MERVGSERVVVAVDAEDTPWCSTGADLVSDRLFALGASAVSELPSAEPAADGGTDGGTDGTAGPGAGTSIDTGRCSASGPAVRLVADLPAASLDELSATGWRFDVLEVDPSWNAAWRDHATAVEVGERLVLRPEWVQPDAAADGPARTGSTESSAPATRIERIEVVLDAADAFGSGSHPTTRLCLELLERLDDAGSLTGARVLDVGSGTGVLGVAALLLGAGSLVAVDVDTAAVTATSRTVELNGVADRVVEISDRPLAEAVADHGPFDVVLANLLIPIIEELGPVLAAAVAPGGALVLSGLLSEPATGQVERAVRASAAEVELVLERVQHTDGWSAVVLVAGSCGSSGRLG